MLQFKSVFLSLGALSMCAIMGLVSVQAQSTPPAQVQPKPTNDQSGKAQPSNSETRTVTNDVKPSDRMICKQEVILGTRLKGMRSCRTASEWRRISRGFQARLKETNDRAGAAFSGN